MNKNWDRYIKELKKNSDESGYVLLSTLFLVLVAITIGISIYMDSLSELGLTNSEESYSEAFNLAEAAIETVLIEDFNDIDDRTITFATDTGNIEVGVIVGEGERFFEAEEVPQNSVVQVQLEGMSNSEVNIYWNDNGSGCGDGGHAALIVETWEEVSGVITVDRKLFDSSSCPTKSDNDNSDVDVIGGVTFGDLIYSNGVQVGPYDGLTAKFMRIRPIYNSASIYVVSNIPDTLPYQMKTVTATAKSVMAGSVNDGEVEMSAIQVERYVGSMPDIFDYVLFTGGTLIK